ncbi:MAG: carboxypeptidase regulatory-like domain-containing protein [Planctomycetes bacterium]|nr:carboxypeptidase regulatory-like domain-containing protein [Planctomycetota bacterium]
MSKKLSFLLVLSVLAAAVVPNIVLADSGEGTSPEHQVLQDRPIQLGTSGGNINDRSSLYCCSGTLGALVEDGVNQYILSNNHVLALSNHGIIGDGINQPGQTDQGCGQKGIVAYLSDFETIRFKKGRRIPINTIDAAIALVVEGAVDPNGRILDIGQISSETTIAQLDQAVQKSGRTTGHTKGIVTDISFSGYVGYSKECGGPSNQLAWFDNQIMIEDTNEVFSAGGDSGSLIVEDTADARAVGLLFAGSSTHTLANPIDDILGTFGVVMAGGATSPPPPPTLTGAITGIVTNSSTGQLIDGADVSTDTGQSAVTQDGLYLLSDVPTGDRQVTASFEGLRDKTQTVTVVADDTTVADFALKVRKGGGGRGKPNTGAIHRALKAKNSHIHRFMDIDGVVGAGVGLSAKGQPVVRVYLSQDSKKVKSQLPSKVDGVPVVTIVTGTFEAF